MIEFVNFTNQLSQSAQINPVIKDNLQEMIEEAAFKFNIDTTFGGEANEKDDIDKGKEDLLGRITGIQDAMGGQAPEGGGAEQAAPEQEAPEGVQAPASPLEQGAQEAI